MKQSAFNGKKILLVHLVSNGDCLMATTLARQIKHNNPGCHLTWAISAACKQVIENNPYVDSIWEINYKANESPFDNVWKKIKNEADIKIKSGEFENVFYSQVLPDNILNYDGATRSSTFRCYPKKISVPISPTIKLYDHEIKNVEKFVTASSLAAYRNIILMECTPNSGQSFFNPQMAISLAEELTKSSKEILVIISSDIRLPNKYEQIIDGSQLSYRENAELSKYCSLLVGCSSGITWLLTSDWAKKIPTVQFLKKNALGFEFASVEYDHKYWGLNTAHIIETSEQNAGPAAQIVRQAMQDFEKAKKLYHEKFTPDVTSVTLIAARYMCFRNTKKIIQMAAYFISRNGSKFYNTLFCVVSITRLFIKKVVFQRTLSLLKLHFRFRNHATG